MVLQALFNSESSLYPGYSFLMLVMLATSKFPSESVNPANQTFEPKGVVSKGSKGIGLGRRWFTILISLWRASILGALGLDPMTEDSRTKVIILPLIRLVIARTPSLLYESKYGIVFILPFPRGN
jgi:hypothetical protein